MKIHHLNAGTMSPFSARLINGRGGLLQRARLVMHVLLLELPDRLVLVDSGLGTNDIAHPELLPPRWVRNVAPRLDRAETAIEQIRARGLSPNDVRDIVVTHLDRDHAGGLSDFPGARVHLHRTEHRAAVTGELPVPPERYSRYQFGHGPNWVIHETFADPWFGLPSERIDLGEGVDVRLIPLPGHTLGHCGVAVKTGTGWLLHAGDSYYVRSQTAMPPQRSPFLLDVFRRRGDADRAQRVTSANAVRGLRRRAEVTIFCTHDPDEFDRLSAAGR